MSNEPSPEHPIEIPVPITPPSLTETERRVLSLVATGMTDTQVGVQIGRSQNQVRYAIRTAMTRLGASTRAQAVAIAFALGYLISGKH
jgi:DNA-binding CsgD family transcriptional regulator